MIKIHILCQYRHVLCDLCVCLYVHIISFTLFVIALIMLIPCVSSLNTKHSVMWLTTFNKFPSTIITSVNTDWHGKTSSDSKKETCFFTMVADFSCFGRHIENYSDKQYFCNPANVDVLVYSQNASMSVKKTWMTCKTATDTIPQWITTTFERWA